MYETPASMIEPELEEGEQLLWAGQPRQGKVLRRIDVLLVPCSLLCGAFFVFWEILVLYAVFAAKDVTAVGPASWLPFFGIPFLAFGFYLIIGRFMVDARLRSRTFYGLTNHRIIVVSGLRSRKVRSVKLDTLRGIKLVEKPDHTGLITFGPSHPIMLVSWSEGMPWPRAPHLVPAFDMIPEARKVYDQIMELQSEGE